MRKQIIEHDTNLETTWTKFDIRGLIAVSGVIDWNNLNELKNARIVIHAELDIVLTLTDTHHYR